MLQISVSSVFAERRKRLMQAHPHTAFLVPANVELIRNASTTFPFRQDSSFHYLTGMDEPEAMLLLVSGSGGKGKSYAFVRSRDPEREIWEGERYGTDRAKKIFGFDECFLITELEQRLPGLLKEAEEIAFPMSHPRRLHDVVQKAHDELKRNRARLSHVVPTIRDSAPWIGEMRLIKDESEVDLMRRSGQITAETHKHIMSWVKPGMNEADVDLELEFGFRRRGSQRLSYGSIVAGGNNATCLHYHHNNCELKDGDLLLIDAAGEYGMYASDITRTFPVGKKFSEKQAQIYDLVLKAQLASIAIAKPGTTIGEVHQKSADVLVDGLIALGLLSGKREDLIGVGAHKRFYPHNTSHWIGLDVHDAGTYMEPGGSRVLKPGMVITIEPGIYIQPNDQAAPAEYRGIGVRIEDDVLITENGNEILTSAVPKERAEIEALRR